MLAANFYRMWKVSQDIGDFEICSITWKWLFLPNASYSLKLIIWRDSHLFIASELMCSFLVRWKMPSDYASIWRRCLSFQLPWSVWTICPPPCYHVMLMSCHVMHIRHVVSCHARRHICHAIMSCLLCYSLFASCSIYMHTFIKYQAIFA